MKRFAHIVGFLMIIVGVSLVVATLGFYFFQAKERDRANRTLQMLKDLPTVVPAPELSADTTWQTSRIQISKLGLHAPVVETNFVDGEWQLPQLAVGHLLGTANPGGTGNVILIGHLNDISGDRVFARLTELAAGDGAVLFGEGKTVDYTVTEVKVVKKDDLSVLMPTSDAALTLITCAGTFDPFAWEYSERLVVIAKPVSNNKGKG